MNRTILLLLALAISFSSIAQKNLSPEGKHWVDSVFESLSDEEKIAQLMVIRAHSNLGPAHVEGVVEQIKKYNVGALCFFQGGPVRQANLTNLYQSIAKTPLMVTIDGEWGLGMRLDSVIKYPYQLTLGALNDPNIVYEMGLAVGRQMKRIGVHVNYAPVVDVNNNPGNPVIGYRSFGEDKYKVAQFGVAYARGMQDAGIMACAKHFPGHGDVTVDSHYDLPVINKTMKELENLELYPFKELFKAGVGSVMIAHLAIPAIDKTLNRPTSLSKNNVTELLREEMEYEGLTFTDALEMKGVSKFFPAGEAAVQAIIAGNDMLCLPENVPLAIDAIKTAIKKKRLKWKDIDEKVKRVLASKYELGLSQPQWIDTNNLLADINSETEDFLQQTARNVVTVMNNNSGFFPVLNQGRIAYVGIGAENTHMGNLLKAEMNADTFFIDYRDTGVKPETVLTSIQLGNYDRVIIGIHNFSQRPANNYGISASAIKLWNELQKFNTATFVFGNVYASENFCTASNLVAMHQDDQAFHRSAVDFLQGKINASGKLPVTVCNTPYGSGIVIRRFVPVGTAPAWLVIDSIMNDAMAKKAFPGAEVIAVQNGEIKYHKAFGKHEFDNRSKPVNLENIFDLASVTKISATTVSIMKLYDEGKIDLDKGIGNYLPVARGTDKEHLTIKNILLHEAGLNPFIRFYLETIDEATGMPSPAFYSREPNTEFTIPVARNIWLRRDWNDSMMKRIVQSKLGPAPKYVYSDNDFILLGKIVEAVSGLTLDQYASQNFYKPLGMTTTGFKPWERFGSERVVPTEEETHFRRQLLRGYVHDEGAAMFGGVSGHAGLFSNAYDLSLLYQMLLNGGELNGRRYLKPETIKLFTTYGSDISRRGLGFDKPEKDNYKRDEPYPSTLASPDTYGHTGFTGTCVWVDPQSDLVYIFLSNRVYNTRNNKLLMQMNVRGKVQDAIYRALKVENELKSAANPPVQKAQGTN